MVSAFMVVEEEICTRIAVESAEVWRCTPKIKELMWGCTATIAEPG